MGLSFSFSYSSFNDFIGLKENPLGINWSHNYQSYCSIEPDSTQIKVYYAGGGIGFFNISSTYQRSTSFGDYNELRKEGNTVYLKTQTQTIFKYDFLEANVNTAYLVSITDRKGNQITLNYDSQKRINSVSLYGRSLLFTYYESTNDQFSDLIEKVTETGLNRSIKFEYDSLRNLVKYTDPNGGLTTYTYHDVLTAWHTITEIKMPNENLIKYEYDDNRKIKKQTSTGDNANSTSYTYNLDASTPNVQIQEANQNKTTLNLINPTQAIPYKITTPTGEIVEMKYEDSLHPLKPTYLKNSKGAVTTYQYDNNGNVIETKLPMNVKNISLNIII
jgi:YD repeat-containing protein